MTYLILLLLFPLILITAILMIEVVVGLWTLSPFIGDPQNVSVAIIVPAHDEEPIIANSLAALVSVAASDVRILVVADNCSDTTAAIARRMAVEVIERSCPTEIGKGFALDFAKSHLRAAPPDVVLVIDSDCRTDRDSIRALIGAAFRSGRPAQAVNLLEPAPSGSPVMQLSTFAFLIKNLIRQRALHRLTGQVRLTGTGMAFPWALFEQANLATGSIVEDLKLGVELAAQGRGARLIESARVWSPAAPESATIDQRRRWEGGLITTARSVVPLALLSAVRRTDLRALLAALDLCIPPLALLLMLDLAALAAAALLTPVSDARWWPLAVLAVTLAAAGLAIAVAWMREGRTFLPPRALARIPFYVLMKLPLYLQLGRGGGPSQWIRTDRASGSDNSAND